MKCIGILRETKSKWERRTPILPEDIVDLINGLHVSFCIQPSRTRIITDNIFKESGLKVDNNLQHCDILIGIKEVKSEEIINNKVYIFFSHTIKGQSYNMKMLKTILEKGCTLIDYERIADAEGKRFIFFGYHAGIAGAIDTLWAYGRRLESENIPSPFQEINRAYTYTGIKEIEGHIQELASQIKSKGLTVSQRPLIFGITGYGNVAQGVQRILGHLPMKWIRPDQIRIADDDAHSVYGVVFKEQDMVETVNDQPFNLKEYYEKPEKYRSVFNRYLPYLSILFNASYWDPRYPKHVTRTDIRKLFGNKKGDVKLKVIGDISCDIEGGVECTLKVTDPGNPVYVYHPDTGNAIDGIDGPGPVIMAVDILPAEIPLDSSVYFSSKLKEIIPYLVQANFNVPFQSLMLPPMIKNAVIVHQGKLAPDYHYLEKYLCE